LKAHGLKFSRIQSSNLRLQINSFLHICSLFNYSLKSSRIKSNVNITELPVLLWKIFFLKYIAVFNIVCSKSASSVLLHIHVSKQNIHIYNYVELYITIFHQHVSFTRVIIIRVSYKSIINIKLIIKFSTMKLLNCTF